MAVRSMQVIARMLCPNLFLLLAFPLCWGADDHFRDITRIVFKNESGYLAAFADFNSDKSIDVFVLIAPTPGKGFTQVDLNQAQISRFSEDPFTRATLLRDLPYEVDSVIPADFNGDRVQDVLLYSKKTSSITIYWGTGDYGNATNLLNPNAKVTVEDVYAEPLLFDFNGDRNIDILTSNETSRKSRTVISCDAKSCRMSPLSESSTGSAAMAEYHSNSFVDLNGDANPDLLVSTENHFEMWIWKSPGVWELDKHNRKYPDPSQVSNIGQSVFVDFDSSGRLTHLLQVATKTDDQILAWTPATDSTAAGWKPVFKLDSKPFKFWKNSKYQDRVNAMMSLKSADLDQDGYPDFMTIYEDLSDPSNPKRAVVSLLNRPCEKGPKCPLGRYLEPIYSPGDFKKFPRVTNLGFFDIRENGKMDVLISQGDLQTANWSIAALENTYAEDACFIKVITVSGLCAKDRCKEKKNIIEYGYNQPGPVVTYSIIDSEGKMRTSMAAQLYQTSHGSLQLPYILFGIGLSPNFVESLDVRMPGLNKSHQWTQIIPNSQMLVIPSPATEPSLWQNKLFITPSRKMLVTGITLFGVVLVNVVIILALHMMEKKADKIERQQQAHRFNFDAM